MFFNLRIVKVDSNYCDYLRKFDYRVSYNKNEKELRPFVGVLFKIKDTSYFAPLSSPKPKHLKMKNSIDFYKIKNGELGAINFNNMIPLMEGNYEIIDLDKRPSNRDERKYYKLLKEQLTWLNEHYRQVKSKSYNLYKLYNSNRLNKSIMDRCCNFKLLEEKCMEYNVKILN